MKREFLQELRVGDSPLPKEVVDAIMTEHGKDIQSHKLSAQQWEEKYNRAVSDHTAQLEKLQFDGYIREAVSAHGGRSLKAITALLDVEQLRQDQNPQQAIEQAVSRLKEENDYLFNSTVTPTPYARGTGTQTGENGDHPSTLADALKQRFGRN